MELLQLRYFCTVAELESVTQAAARFGVPQPGVSRTIARLEQELGCPLFDRTGKRIQLNEQGHCFYRYAAQALSALQDGQAALADRPDGLSGTVRMRVLTNRRAIIEQIYQYKTQAPDVRFSIRHFLSDADEFDLCISAQPPNGFSCKGYPLIREKLMLAVSTGHPLAGAQSVSLAQLNGEDFVGMTENNSVSEISLNLCRARGFLPNVTISCDDPYFVRKYVSLGLGVAFAPAFSWKGMFDDNVVLLPIRETGFERVTSVYERSDRYLSAAACRFRDFLRQVFSPE